MIDTLTGMVSIEDVMYEGPCGVRVIPAGITLDGFNEENMEMLKASLREIPKDVDILVIDAPAGRDAAMVMDGGQEVIIVTMPEVSSVSDALKMKILAERMGAKVVGVIMNRVENKSRELDKGEVENTLDSSVISIIPESESIKEALAYEVPFVLEYPDSKPSIIIKTLAANLIGKRYTPQEKGFISKIKSYFR
ncbi:MAG: P-loop NTPase [Candidatus Hydrothermarchaeales archaeon]